MPSVKGKKVLIFGDSLSSGQSSPGWFMGKGLGGTIRINARVGRSAFNFYDREDVTGQLLAVQTFDPDIVIVELGTNDIGLSMTKDGARMAQLKRELGAGGAEVWAFGPPSFPAGKQHDGSPPVVAMMRQVFGSRFIDLRPLTADLLSSTHRTPDQIHFTTAGAKLAGERMAARFEGAGAGAGRGVAVGVAIGIALWLVFLR